MRLGIVGAGSRGRFLMKAAYKIRDQEYLLCETEKNSPHEYYHRYSETVPDWAEDITDLVPEIAAICDASRESRTRAEKICQEYGDQPAFYDSFAEFSNSDEYDAVILATPNDYHAEQSLELLEIDMDVFCEKPIATTLEDHDRLIDASNASNALYFVGFNLRSSPFYIRLKELLQEGTIGRLGMISCRECRRHLVADYSFTQDRSGGALLDKNSHDFDLYNWYAEADPVSVSAFGGQHVHAKNTDVNDYATVIVRYENGVVGTLELCLYAPFGERTRMYELRGSDGLLRAPDESGAVDLFTRNQQDRFTVQNAKDGHGGADILQMKRFLRCVQGRDEPPATAVDAKKADAVALAGERAIAEDTVVEIDSEYDLTF